MKAIKGYCIVADTLCGPALWTVMKEDDETMPEVHEDIEDARKSIIENAMDKFNDYLQGDCEWEDLDMEIQQYVAKIEIDSDGRMIVFQTGISGDIRHGILETTLSDWRENL